MSLIFEAKFLAGTFFDLDLPREKLFIFKYFRSPLEHQFVRYYMCFGEIDNFVEHTGYFCQKRWLRILQRRFEKVMAQHEFLKSNFMLEALKELERGKYSPK